MTDELLFKDFCWESWKAQYGTSPPWGKAEFVLLNEARKRIDTEEVARDAWTSFLMVQDPFYEGHDPKRFLNSLSRWVVQAIPKPKKKRTFPGAARAAEMARIMREVEYDDTIPPERKMDERKKRWSEIR